MHIHLIIQMPKEQLSDLVIYGGIIDRDIIIYRVTLY